MGFSETFNKVSQDVLFYTLCIYRFSNKLLRQVKNRDLILEASNFQVILSVMGVAVAKSIGRPRLKRLAGIKK